MTWRSPIERCSRTAIRNTAPPCRKCQRVDILNRQRIRFVFKRSGNPLLILRLGELPVLPQHYWKHRDFKATTFEAPLGSGPYRITSVRRADS
jgi:microcin C transport system substrate-binding protein